MVALVPARKGSKRIPGKNTKRLGGKPLICWTVQAALDSGVFSRVIVSSDDEDAFRAVGGMDVLSIERPAEYATDEAPDILWVRHVLGQLKDKPGAFAILRPTSPFRTADTIHRAFRDFISRGCIDSMRAVQKVKEHPMKMWRLGPGALMSPFMPVWDYDKPPAHSRPTQTLPSVYVQNASLEMAHSKVIEMFGTISGENVVPFFTQGLEGFDINTPEDWAQAERLMEQRAIAC